MPRHFQRGPQETFSLWQRATTARARERLLAEAVRHARRADSLAGAQTVARLFPFPPVLAAAALEWDRRRAVLEEFIAWLEELDDWCDTAPKPVLARIPTRLYPSRMARAATVWAKGPGGIEPRRLRTEFVTAQGLALARTNIGEPGDLEVEEFLGYDGATGAWEIHTSSANEITAVAYSDSLAGITAAPSATRYRISLPGWEDDNAPIADGTVTLQAAQGETWNDVWPVDFNGTMSAETTIDLANVSAWRFRFDLDLILNFRPQMHVWRVTTL